MNAMSAGRTLALSLGLLALEIVSAPADPQADFKSVTLSGYLAECTAYSVQLCEVALGGYVRARWTERHGADTEETCTGSAGNQALSVRDLGETIYTWLSAHPELGPLPAAQAFVSAVDANYSCVDQAETRPQGENAKPPQSDAPKYGDP